MKGDKWKTSRTTSSRSLRRTQRTKGGHRRTSRWSLTFSQEMLTGCKPPIANLLKTLADTCDVGSGGCIARCSIFAVATQEVSGMLWPHYRRHSMRRMSVLCERSKRQTGSLRTDCFNLSLSLPALSVLKNWRSSSHSISTRGQPQDTMRDGVWKIQSMWYNPLAPVFLPSSISEVPKLYNFLIFPSRNS